MPAIQQQYPLLGDPYWADVVALLHCDGTNGSTTFIDSSPLASNFTQGGTAAISTAQSVFGGAAVNSNATSSVNATAASANFVFGTGDFTIEMWEMQTSLTGTQILYDQRPSGASGAYPTIYAASGTIVYLVNGANLIVGPTLVVNTWYHVAVSRVSGTMRMFINGSLVGSHADTTNYADPTNRPFIGGNSNAPDASSGWLGYVDEVRVTKGVGRYTGNFPTPTCPFPNGC